MGTLQAGASEHLKLRGTRRSTPTGIPSHGAGPGLEAGRVAAVSFLISCGGAQGAATVTSRCSFANAARALRRSHCRQPSGRSWVGLERLVPRSLKTSRRQLPHSSREWVKRKPYPRPPAPESSPERRRAARRRLRIRHMKNRRRPTLPGGCPPSTIGAERLNCSVRNGKRCLPFAMHHRNLARRSVELENCTRQVWVKK